MKPTYEQLEQKVIELTKKLEWAMKRIEALEEQLNINSKNSSKPPSTDQKTNKGPLKQGGAVKGHPGHFRKMVENPTYIQEYKPKACSQCGSSDVNVNNPWVFQQWEIPKASPIVTEYRCYGCTCQSCGNKQPAILPQGVEYSAFGPNLAARIALLTSKFRLSKRQAMSLIRLDHGIDLSVGSVSNIEGRMAKALEKPYTDIREAILASNDPKHIDETGMRQEVRNHFLWLVSTKKAVYISVLPGRSRKDFLSFLPKDISGPVVTDRYGVYNFPKHQWCWAHLARDLKRYSEKNGRDGEIGQALLFEVKDMLRVHARYREGKLAREKAYQGIYYRRKRIDELFWDALVEGSGKLASFAEKCIDNAKKLWLFAKLQGVEPTNNQAERDLRPLVIWRKTSFGTRSERGSDFVQKSMSVIATLERGQGNISDFFEAAYRSRFDASIVCPSPVYA